MVLLSVWESGNFLFHFDFLKTISLDMEFLIGSPFSFLWALYHSIVFS